MARFLILSLFYDAVSTADIVQRQMKWDDREYVGTWNEAAIAC
jgi:hypothetical protein